MRSASPRAKSRTSSRSVQITSMWRGTAGSRAGRRSRVRSPADLCMARINQDLLEAIADRQRISLRAAYPQITKIVHETFLERELAALVLASRLRINIRKYSTHAQRDQIRNYLTGAGSNSRDSPAPAPAGPVARTPVRKGKPGKTKKTKGN